MLKHGRGDLQKKAGAELDSHIAKAIALLTSSASAALLRLWPLSLTARAWSLASQLGLSLSACMRAGAARACMMFTSPSEL